ncbi:bifunctional ADP-dependent NAD(P)H-hydrate dehydratase/NAD(P)H-hydrate epimerase [Syntrophorhabdus aromaticivorans]|uniref:Bifunctional NAD(P)H-hydrate repair enzyme n=1 Tax=Syntrophorhabdus aromaticivorans TaxID=328301 RepID=A0A971M397_9BACT|nr:bifunctional ADP-dependent NAD(P)H-hydrate dehydratase/NAD(P)H-hydrate epimerase [Syntrophorhabdus aromaticivorans]NLW35248.1 bifunctional ADP-dependent NAD(P)H-hydrate dehydratase/NAD(P)H-hydrate epimerase [Syntrophorhabdus aromaticivorans]
MVVLTPERMAKYDAYAIQTWGIPSAVLMENAGRNTYRLMKERYLSGRERLVIFCGKGNNGGDGFVVGRYALLDGFAVTLFLLGRTVDLKGDAALNMGLYRSLGGTIVECIDGSSGIAQSISDGDIIIDAIFGTGLSKPVQGIEREAIEQINGSGKTVIAVDIPSGIDGRTGRPLGSAVRAAHTFTYGYPKIGQLLCPGAYHAGRLTVIDISIPSFTEKTVGIDGHVIDGEMLRGFLKRRLPWDHKGTFGHVAVIAGSPGKTGAAHMTSLAALKIGAGLVTLLIPASLNPIMEVKLTEVMTLPVPDKGTGFFTLSAYDKIAEFVRDKDVVVMGPGLSREPETSAVVRRLYEEMDKPFVIDADGINAFQGHDDLLKGGRRKAIFTPHPGELSRLAGMTPKEINQDRVEAARRFVAATGANLILKGARTVILGPQGDLYINPTGNPALAKGGSGDILTGFVGGLLSQGYSMIESSLLGTYLHGYIADTWTARNTDMDLLAGDLLAGLSEAIRDVRDEKERIYVEKSL